MVKLVVVDHHEGEKEFYSKHGNVNIIEGGTVEEFYEKSKEYVNKDFDLIVTDQDPDGLCSALVYFLNNRKGKFKCTRKAFTKEDVEKWKEEGIKEILALDFWPLKYSELEAFEEIIIINPQIVGLPNINSSELVYRMLPSRDFFARDISTIGTVCDYQVETAKEKVYETIREYKGLFPTLMPLVEEDKLDSYNIWNSNFKILCDMFWAPYILKGEEGGEELIRKIQAFIPFTFTELLGWSNNNGTQYLKALGKELGEVFAKEKEHFEKTKREEGEFIFYESNSHKRITSKFSSILSEENPDKIIVMRSKTEDGSYKYSLRRRKQEVALNKAAEKACLGLGCQGGGHEEAAGVLDVRNPEEFERNLMEEVKKQTT